MNQKTRTVPALLLVVAGLVLINPLAGWALDLNDVQAVYGEQEPTEDDSLRYRWHNFDNDTGACPLGPCWSPNSTFAVNPGATSGTDEIHWVQVARSPRGDRAIAVTVTDAASGSRWIDAFAYPGWSRISGFPLDLGTAGASNLPKIAVAYEQRSGRALLVYRKPGLAGQATISYRWVENDGTVVAQQDLGLIPSTSVQTIKLIPRPRSNQILLLANDNASNLVTWKWDGSVWTQMFGTGGSVVATSAAYFDADWGPGGELLLVYRREAGGDQTSYRAMPVGTTTWRDFANLVGGTNTGVAVTSEPNGTRVAVGTHNGQNHFNASIWDWANCTFPAVPFPPTTCWLDTNSAVAGTDINLLIENSFATPELEVAWAGSGSGARAFMVYAAAGASSKVIDWAIWMPVQAGTITTTGGASTLVTGSGGTTFTTPTLYQPGDLLVAGNQARVIASITSPTSLTTTTPFSALTNAPIGGWVRQSADALDTSAIVADAEYSFIFEPFFDRSTLLLMFSEFSGRQLMSTVYDLTTSTWTQMRRDDGALTSIAGTLPNNGGVASTTFVGRPFGLAINRFVVPTIEPAANTYMPVKASTPDAPKLTITDPGGVIYNETPNDGDAITTQDLVVVSAVPVVTGGSLSFAGTANTKVGILGWPNSTTLTIDVASDFALGDTLIINDPAASNKLKFNLMGNETAGTPLQFTLRSNVRPDMDTTKDWEEPFVSTTTTAKLVESLELMNPTAQAKNAFLQTGSVTAAPLLRFKLQARGGDVLPTQFKVFFSPSGTTPPTPSSWKLYRDTNDNGIVDAGDVGPLTGTVLGSQVTFNELGGTDALSLLKKITTTATASYLVVADVSSLDAGDALLVSIAGTDLDANGLTSGYLGLKGVTLNGGAIFETGLSKQKTHTVSTYTMTLSGADLNASSQIAVGRTLTITWTKVNANNPTAIEYTLNNGTSWASTGCSLTVSPCSWVIPTALASAASQARIRFTGTETTDNQAITTTSSAFTVTGRLTLGEPTTQALNALTSLTMAAPADLFKLKLTADGENVTLTALTFTFAGTGIATSELSSFALVQDGTPLTGVAFTTTATSITATKALTIAAGATGSTFTLRAQVAGLAAGDSMTLGATTAGLASPTGVTSGVSLTGVPNAVTGTVVSKSHTVSTYTMTVPATVKTGDPLSFSWVKINVGDPTLFEYSVDGKVLTDPTKSWIDFAGPSPTRCPLGSASTCSATAPTTDATNLVSAAAYVRLNGIESTNNQPITPAVSPSFKVIERMTVANPASQVPNALRQTSGIGGDPFGLTGIDILKLKLTSAGGNVTVSRLQFTVNAPGIGQANYRLIDDVDGSVIATAPAPALPDFPSLTLPVNLTGHTYRLRVDASGLDPGETLNASLDPSGVFSSGQVTSTALTAEGSAVSMLHTVSTYVVTSPTLNDEVVVGSAWMITWATHGLADAVNPSVEYQVDGGAWKPRTCTAPRAAGVCDTTVPDDVGDIVILRLSDGVHTALSRDFRIAGVISIGVGGDNTLIGQLDLPGGRTWIYGNTHNVTWQQLGWFTTLMELSIDDGNSFPYNANTFTPPGPVLTTTSFTSPCNKLGVNQTQDLPPCAVGLPASGTDTARVQVRPQGSAPTQGNRVSAVFKIKPAFLSITPGGADIVRGRQVTIDWQSLAGTEPASVNPFTDFPITAVKVDVLDAVGAIIPGGNLTASSSNNPALGAITWTPNALGTGLQIRMCAVSLPTICGYGPSFDVIDLSVSITPDSALGFVPNGPTTINWAGVDPGQQVTLMLLNASGTPIWNTVSDLPPPSSVSTSSNPGSIPWTIPASFSTPMNNVRIRLEQVGSPSVWAESAPFTIRGELRVTAPDGGEQLLINQATPISWSVISGTTAAVRLRYSSTGATDPADPSWEVLTLSQPVGTPYPWIPDAVTAQGRIEVCDEFDLQVCDYSNADFSVVGRLSLAEYTPGGQAANAFVQLPTVTDGELYRFALTRTGEDVDLASLRFDLSSVVGIAASHITGLSLLQDGNPVTASFSVSPAAAPSQIMATLTGVTVTGTSQFILKGTVGNLAANDEMTVGLNAASGIQAQGATTSADLDALGAVSGSVSTIRHITKLYVVDAPLAGANWPVNTTQDIRWTPIGGASATNVRISYSTDGGTNYTTIPGADGPNVANPFPWTIPQSAISAQAKIRIVDRANASILGYSGGTPAGNLFNITGQITITAPASDPRYADGRPRWPVQTLQTAQWTTVGTMSAFDVYLDAALIGDDVTGTSFAYTPTTPSPLATLRVVDVSPGHPPAEGTVDVVVSEIKALEPNISSAWLVDSPQMIRWAQTGLDTVDLFYRVGGGAWQPIALAQDAALLQSAWSPPAAARGPQVDVRLRDAVDSANGAADVSDTFAVYGTLQLDPVSGVAVNTLKTVTWSTMPVGSVPRVRLELIDVSRGQTSVIAADEANAGSFDWTPALATAQAKLRLCDVDFPSTHPNACNESNLFSITGIGVDPIPAGPHLPGSVLPISWTQEGVVAGQVRVAYSPDGGATWKAMNGTACPPAALPRNCGTTVPTGATGNYTWTIPDDLSVSVVVRVADAGVAGTAFGLSNAFGITGQLTVTGPAAGSVFAVTDPMPISWTTLGTIPTVDLEYSLNGGAAWAPLAGGQANSGAYNWALPTDVISNNLRVRVLDAAGVGAGAIHPFAEGRSGALLVGAKFTVTSPAGGESWSVNSPQSLSWTVTGDGVTAVTLEVFTADGLTKLADIATTVMAGTSGETGTQAWNVFDVVDALGDPQINPSQPFLVRLKDATANHPAVVGAGRQDSASPTAFYYKVDWEVRDVSSPLIVLNNLQVIDSTGWTNQPDFDLTGLQTRYYPYLAQASTLWSLANNNGASDQSQGPADAQPVSIWASDQDQTRVVKIEVASADSVTWQVHSAYQYDPVNPADPLDDRVELSAWLEKSGKIVDTLLTDAFVELYEDGALIRTLPAVTADPNGNFRLLWDLKRDDSTSVPDGKTYFAKTIIRRLSREFSTGGALNIIVPKKILSGGSGAGGGLSLTDLQTELAPIKTDVGEVKTAVTTTLPSQLTAAQTAIQTDIANAQGAIQTDIAAAQGAIQADVAAARTDIAGVQTSVDGVQSYLSDPTAGLPKVLGNQTEMKDQLKAQRKGKILNRETSVEPGESITIRYQPGDPTMVPTIQINGPGFGVGPSPMALNGGLYEFSQFFDATAALGEYTVVVSEAASATGLSDGTVDSLGLRVRAPVATGQDLNTLMSEVTGIRDRLDFQVIPALGLIQGYTDGIEGMVDQLEADTQTLITNWSGLTAQNLMDELTNLATTIGTPPPGSSIYAEMAKDATVAKETMLSALDARVGAISDGRTLAQALEDTEAAVQAIPGATDYTVRFDTLEQQLGVPVGKTIYGDMAKEATLGAPANGSIAADIAAITSGGGAGGGGDLTTIQNLLNDVKGALGADSLIAAGVTLEQLNSAAKLAADNAKLAADTAATEAGAAKLAADAAKLSADAADLKAGDLKTALGADSLIAAGVTLEQLNSAAKLAADDANATAGEARDRAIEGRDYALAGRDYALAGRDYALEARDRVGVPTAASLAQDVADFRNAFNAVAGTSGVTMDTMQTRFDTVEDLINALPQTQIADQAAQLDAISTELDGLEAQLTALSGSGQTSADTLLTQLNIVKDTVNELKSVTGADKETLVSKLAELKQTLETAKGSSAAVALSDSANAAARQALTILETIRSEVGKDGGIPANGAVLLGEAVDKLRDISKTVTVLPGQLGDEEIAKQLKKLAEQTNGIATDKGYHFDSLYEMSETQTTDVKTMRNQVEEMRVLLEIQRSILEKNINQPVMKTWFESN